MPYCSKCGALLNANANFCGKCGAPIASDAAPQLPTADLRQQGINAAPKNMPQAPMMKDFSRVTVRYCCPNGHAFDGKQGVVSCPTCGATIPEGGYIQLYRMGNYMGCAVGMGIYIDGISYGHIANKQSLRIKVPYGSHKVHITHTSTRKCNDPIITVTPQTPHIFGKVHFVKAGFAISIDPASPNDMPTE